MPCARRRVGLVPVRDWSGRTPWCPHVHRCRRWVARCGDPAAVIDVKLVVHGVDLSDEQQELLEMFVAGLLGPTGDGRRKREAGLKPFWRVDPSHLEKLRNHLGRLEQDPGEVDADSGVSGWWHASWRCAALAVQADDRRVS